MAFTIFLLVIEESSSSAKAMFPSSSSLIESLETTWGLPSLSTVPKLHGVTVL
jgi:hypothetical protein